MPVYDFEAPDPGAHMRQQELTHAANLYKLQHVTSKLFYAQCRLVLQPCEALDDEVGLVGLEYIEKFTEAAHSGSELEQTSSTFVKFVDEQRESRHGALRQALRQGPRSMRHPKFRKLHRTAKSLATLRGQAQARTKSAVLEMVADESDWSKYELQTYQKQWLAAQASEDVRAEIGWERRIFAEAAYPVHSLFSVALKGIELDRR